MIWLCLLQRVAKFSKLYGKTRYIRADNRAKMEPSLYDIVTPKNVNGSQNSQVPKDETDSCDICLIKKSLKDVDREMYDLITAEKKRQRSSLDLIASENFVPGAVLEALGSCLTNKYAEGYPGNRYYGGSEIIDKIELLTQRRALEVFGLDPEEWGVNVQALSGSPANFAVYHALVGPHGRIMGQDLPDGGHLSHGFYTHNKKVSATSVFFESMPYKVDPVTGLIDYDKLAETALLFKPKLIVAGVSAYTRNLDYGRFRQIADSVKSILMADMAHVSGLVAAKLCANPFEFCDVVTTTTHKSMRGPRGALIFYRKATVNSEGDSNNLNYEKLINEAVFPGLQGGPHQNVIASIGVTLKFMMSPQFKIYASQVIKNSKALVEALKCYGYHFVTGGTDVHMSLMSLQSVGVDGKRVQLVLDEARISVNKNMIPGDKSALNPHGIRLGTLALTSRGMMECDMAVVANFIHKGIKLAVEIQKLTPDSLYKSFVKTLHWSNLKSDIENLRTEVTQFAEQFPMPGLDNI